MDLIFFLELMGLGLMAGTLGSMVGIGGGVLLVPTLTLLLHLPVHQAIGASIMSVIATSTTAAGAYLEEGLTNIRLAMVLEIASAFGAILGGITASVLNRNTLSGIFAIVLILTMISMFKKKDIKPAQTSKSGFKSLSGAYYDKYLKEQIEYSVSRLPVGFGISFIAGNLSGLLGIGGGVLKVPAMTLGMGIPMRAAAATSNLMVGITAIASAYIYYTRGMINPLIVAPVIIGTFLGALIGTRLSTHVKSKVLGNILAIILGILAINMALYAFGINI